MVVVVGAIYRVKDVRFMSFNCSVLPGSGLKNHRKLWRTGWLFKLISTTLQFCSSIKPGAWDQTKNIHILWWTRKHWTSESKFSLQTHGGLLKLLEHQFQTSIYHHKFFYKPCKLWHFYKMLTAYCKSNY